MSTYRVAASALEKTGLSTAVMRGNCYRPADSLGALAAEAADALRWSDRALVTVYHAQLDGTGHVFGCGSDAWRFQLGHVDKLAEQLATAIPAGTPLYVTADHGMTDVAPEDRIDADSIPGLLDGIALLGGEPRARHLYTVPGAADDVLQTWRDIIGDRAWVLSRDEAVGAAGSARWSPGGPPDRRRGGRACLPGGRDRQPVGGAGVLPRRHARLADLGRPAGAVAVPAGSSMKWAPAPSSQAIPAEQARPRPVR